MRARLSGKSVKRLTKIIPDYQYFLLRRPLRRAFSIPLRRNSGHPLRRIFANPLRLDARGPQNGVPNTEVP